MLTAAVNAAWEYNDVQDEMGRNAPQHQATVMSSREDSFLKLARLPNGRTSVSFKVLGRIIDGSSDAYVPTLQSAFIDIRFDDHPIRRYSLDMLSNLGLDKGFITEKQRPDFVKALRGAKTLRMEVPIYGIGQVVYTFDVDGLIW